MNLLKKTLIKGEIFLEYAFLTYEFCFDNESQSAVSAEYIFALPSGAMISDLKIMCASGKTIRTSVISVSHASKIKEALSSTAILRQLDETTYVFSMGNMEAGVSNIRLKVYVPLSCIENEQSLIIPLAVGGYGGKKSETLANISLILHGENLNYSSPTHTLKENKEDNIFEIFTDEILADRDFCLRISNTQRKNLAIVVGRGFGGEMLCRLYPNKDFASQFVSSFKKILLIYDATGSLVHGTAKAGCEAVLSMAEAFGGEFAVVAAQEQPRMLTNGFCANTPENISALVEKLSNLEVGGGSLGLAIEYASRLSDKDALTVLVSGTQLSEGGIALDIVEKSFVKGDLRAVTVGATAKGFDAERLTSVCKGRREHIFAEDNISARAGVILNNFCRPNWEEIEVNVGGNESHIVDFSDDGITVYVKYTGEAPPRELVIKMGNTEQTVRIDDMSVYKRFVPIGLVCARLIYSKLADRLSVCKPDEIADIRRLMEEVGIKYSAINSETALAAVVSGAKSAVIRIAVPSEACNSYEVFADRSSIFGEVAISDMDERKRIKIFEACLDIVLKSMRADGAICADGEVNPKIRKQQSLVALLAVVAAGLSDRYATFLKRGIDYVGADFESKGLKFTTEKQLATDQISKLWGDGYELPSGTVPDLLSASKYIAIQRTGL